jgi:hypothetical protein
MTIIGDVFYYIITPQDYYNAHKQAGSPVPSSKSPSSAGSASSRKSILFGKKHKTLAERIYAALLPKEHGSPEQHSDKRKLHLVLTEPLTLLQDENSQQGSEKSKKSLEINTDPVVTTRPRRPSADDIFQFIAKSSPTEKNAPIPNLAPLKPNSVHSNEKDVKLEFALDIPTRPSRHKRSKSTTAAHHPAPLPDSSQMVGLSHRWDLIDSFNMRAREPIKFKVRSISYKNEQLNNDQPYALSVEEWISLHCGETVTRLLLDNLSSPKDSKKLPGGIRQRKSPTSEKPSGDGVTLNIDGIKKRKPILYEAKFYATDDDFLMKSSVRQYFKNQAIEADDAVLFTIPSTTTVILPHEPGMEPHPALAGFSYAIEDDSHRSRVARWVTQSHALKYIVVCYIVASALIIRYATPEPFMYFATFVAILILCIFLVFFVEFEM